MRVTLSMPQQLCSVGILLLCMLASCLGVASADDARDVARGERLYYEHACYACHGFNGQTGAREFVGTDSPIVKDERLFLTFLRARSDVAPVLPSTRMPSYSSEVLSDAEALDILAYIQTFTLDAPEPEEVPTLKSILELAGASTAE